MTDDDIVDRVLQYEGGFVNNPLDRGGPTNFGITASELGRVRNLNRAASAAEVQALTRSEAVAIYKADYIAAPKFASIADPGLRMIVVDSGVMHGVGRATKWLQQALGVAGDGQIGPETLDALSKTGPATVGRDVLALRFGFIGSILSAQPRQAVFAQGWLRRVADLLQFA